MRRAWWGVVAAAVLCGHGANAEPGHPFNSAAVAGAGGTGVTASGTPGCMAGNPASVAWLRGAHAEAGAAGVVQLRAATPVDRGGRLAQHRAKVDPQVPPTVAIAHGTGSVAAGVVVYAPWLASVRWPSNWAGRTQGVARTHRVVTVNPVLGYRLGRISVGLGLHVAGGWLEDERVLQTPAGETRLRINGPEAGVGFGAGLMFQPSPWLTVGVHHRSRMVLGSVSPARVSAPPPDNQCSEGQACLVDQQALTTSQWPDVAVMGVRIHSWPGGPTFSAEGGVAMWSAAGPPVLVLPKARVSALKLGGSLRDAWSARVGVEQVLWMVAPDLRVRAGAFFEQAPRARGRVQPDSPWLDQLGWTLGGGWRLYGLAMDVAWVSGVGVPDTGQVGGATVWHVNTVQMLVVSLGWRMLLPRG